MIMVQNDRQTGQPHRTLSPAKKLAHPSSPFEALPTIREPLLIGIRQLDTNSTGAIHIRCDPANGSVFRREMPTAVMVSPDVTDAWSSAAQLPSTLDDLTVVDHVAGGDASMVATSIADNVDEAVKCIFLCEFHATAGPKIAAQVPQNYITKELFDTVNCYIIPKLQLQRSFLSVSLLGMKILGYPVRIDNKLYARNAFYFNFCFVFAPQTRSVVYEPVVRKLTEYMLSLESSSKLLSQRNDAGQMARLTQLLAQVRHDINRQKMCMLQEGSTIIPLCVVPHNRETPIIHAHGAAVLNSEFYRYTYSQWDLTTLRILPYVNGFNHINRISAMADVALGLVIDCIKHLVLLGVAIVVPVFQYSNVYRPTPKLSQFAKCKEMQRRCLQRCSKSSRRQATVRDIFRMFASMAHGATFGELCVRFNPAQLNINEKQMVLFGLLEGLIRRVDKYPITVSRNLFIDDEDCNIRARAAAASAATAAAAAVAINVATTAITTEPDANTIVTLQPSIISITNGGSTAIATATTDPSAQMTATAAAATATPPLLVTTAYHQRLQLHKNAAAVTAAIGVPAHRNQQRDRTTWPLQRGTDRPPEQSIGRNHQQLHMQLHPNHTSRVQDYQYAGNGAPLPICFYNGLKTLDEICCSRGISCQQLEVQLARDRHVIVLLK